MLCGTNAMNCTPEKLFKYLGTYNKAIRIPFTIDVKLIDNNLILTEQNRTIIPMNTTAFKCNDASDISNQPCSCMDCTTCKAIENFPYIFEVNNYFINSNKKTYP